MPPKALRSALETYRGIGRKPSQVGVSSDNDKPTLILTLGDEKQPHTLQFDAFISYADVMKNRLKPFMSPRTFENEACHITMQSYTTAMYGNIYSRIGG